MTSTRLVQIGVIGAPHGVRGEVRVKAFTADPASLAAYGKLTDGSGARTLRIAAFRTLKGDMGVARFDGVATREAARALTGVGLYVAREALPASRDEDDFYHADLIGLRVDTTAGAVVGEVVAVQNFGADDLLEVRLTGGRRTVYLPFTKTVVPVIDLVGGRLAVDPPEGSLDEAAPKTAPRAERSA